MRGTGFFILLTNVKAKRLREYRGFIGEEDSNDIVGIFSKKRAPSILGTEKFQDWVKAKYSTKFQEEISETKVLVHGKKKINDSVSKVYSVEIRSLYGVH